MGPELVWPLALVALALLLVPAGCLYFGVGLGERLNAGELLVKTRELAEQTAENVELKAQLVQVQETAVDAVRRAGSAIKNAKELGAALADPDDDAAFDGVLRVAGDGPRPAAPASPAAGDPA